MRKFDEALHQEYSRILAIPVLATRAREVRRAIALLEHSHDDMIVERALIVRKLYHEFGWTYEKIAKYFRLSTTSARRIVNGDERAAQRDNPQERHPVM